ncbi:TonB C-terminal domain-containing protein [Brevifollis gellanilyticus]|uniref:TonB C-terminal domain-containing protein n=1 Tax=Brevifollis gellanilyticus TaxID=748831 RepID=A0A512MFD2_9BACT|nr:TonB C-terminal domain-containing protein [Brevifollis gellanilyticus]GEP45459.1 hypothetical protein BGE01nite_47500 [Brevifollis gellanilyticus]
MAATSHRASLEPLTPALVGIGLLHVLGGMLLWILLPMLPSKDKPASPLPANLVWRTPADFVGAPMPLELPDEAPRTAEKPASPPPQPAAATPAPTPAKPATVAKNEGAGLSLSASGVSLVPSGSPSALLQLPPDTLTLLQNSIGSTSGMNGVKPGLAAQILGASPPSLPPVTMQSQPQAPAVKQDKAPATAAVAPGPPPVQPGQGREANKYITLSAIVDAPPVPTEPTLRLLDIAKLNDFERTRKASVDASGLDAVERALQKTLMNAWSPPSIDLVPVNHRHVSVELAVLKDGTVKDAVLVTPSGSEALDASVRAVLARVTKIPESLPASYSKERYAVRVNLQIE